MSEWNELEHKLDVELEHNLSQLQKIAAIYNRVGMTKQASEIADLISRANVIDLNPPGERKSA